MQLFRRIEEALRRWRRVRPRVNRQEPISWRWRAVLAAVFLCAIMLGFRLALPERALLSKGLALVYRNSGVILLAGEMDISYPLTLRYAACRLTVSPLDFPLELDELEITPRLSSLLWAEPAATLEVKGYGGELSGWLASDGQVDLVVNSLELDKLPVLPGKYRLSGTLGASVAGNSRASEGLDWTLSMSGLKLAGLEDLGIEQGLELGRLRGAGSVKGNNLEVATLRLEQGVLEATATGSLIVGETADRSRVALELKVRHSDGLPPMLRDLLTLKGQGPNAEGWRSYRINGRLSSPAIR